MLDLFPFLSDVKVNRQWAGMADMTPDFAPIMGTTPGRGLLPRRRLGHLGLQGHAGLRQDDGPHRRHRMRHHPLITGFSLTASRASS